MMKGLIQRGRGSFWGVVSEAKVLELEMKVNLILKGLNLLLFEEGEVISEKEAEELKDRMEDYIKLKDSEFVMLEDVQGPHP